MKRPNRHVKRQGFRMDEREPVKPHRQCQHGFVPAELYVREQTLKVPLQLAAIQHCLDCPEWRRQHALTETMIALLTLNKNRPKPMLKQRQELQAVSE
jgi:hypothetical protein